MYKTRIHLRKDDTEMMRIVHHVYFANNVMWKIHDNGTCVLKNMPYMTFTLAERNRLFYDMFMYYFKKNYDEIDVVMQCSGAKKDYNYLVKNSLTGLAYLLTFMFMFFYVTKNYNTDNHKNMPTNILKTLKGTIKATKELLQENSQISQINYDMKYCGDLATKKQNDEDFNTKECSNFMLKLAIELLKNKKSPSKYVYVFTALKNIFNEKSKQKSKLLNALNDEETIKDMVLQRKDTVLQREKGKIQKKINDITVNEKKLENDIKIENIKLTVSIDKDIENEKTKVYNLDTKTLDIEKETDIKKAAIGNIFDQKSNELNNDLNVVQTTLTKNREELKALSAEKNKKNEELKALSAEQNEKDKEDDYGDVRILGEEDKEREKAIDQMKTLGAKIKSVKEKETELKQKIKSDEEKETKIKKKLKALEQSKKEELANLEKTKETKIENLKEEKKTFEQTKKTTIAALEQSKKDQLEKIKKENNEELKKLKKEKAELEKIKKQLRVPDLDTTQTVTEALDASKEFLDSVSEDQLEDAILQISDLSSNSVMSQLATGMLRQVKAHGAIEKSLISFILQNENKSTHLNRFIVERFMFANNFFMYSLGVILSGLIPISWLNSKYLNFGNLGVQFIMKWSLNDIDWDYGNIWFVCALSMSWLLNRVMRMGLAFECSKKCSIAKYAKNEYYYDPNSLRIELVQDVIQAGNDDVRMIFLPGQSVTFRGVQYIIIAIHGDKDEKRIAVKEEYFANDVISSTHVTMFEIKECFSTLGIYMDRLMDRDIKYTTVGNSHGDKNFITENRSRQNAIYSIPILFKYKNITYCLGESGKIKPYANISNRGLQRVNDRSFCFSILKGQTKEGYNFQEKMIQLGESDDDNQTPTLWFRNL